MAHTQENTKRAVGNVPEEAEMLDFVEKDFKSAI